MPSHCTKAIVLSSIPYSESSLICKLYTEDFGLKSYILRSTKKKDSKTPHQHFQALNIIEFESYKHSKSKLETIKTSSLILSNQSTNFSIIKTSLTFFIAEVINLSLKEDNPNQELFQYISKQIEILTNFQEEELSEFHLNFMIKFAELLGLAPMNNYSALTPFFDPIAGKYSNKAEPQNFNSELSLMLHQLIKNSKENKTERICINKIQRNSLLDALIIFYGIHITNHQQIKSHKILSTILS